MKLPSILSETAELEVSGGEGGAPAEADAAPATEPDQPWSLTRDEWEKTQESLSQIGQFLPVLGQLGEMLNAEQQPQTESPAEVDFYEDPERWLESKLDKWSQDRFGSIERFANDYVEDRGRSAMTEEFKAYESEHGEFAGGDDARRAVEALAQSMFAAVDTSRLNGYQQADAATKVFRQAADHIKALERAAFDRGIQASRSNVDLISGATNTLGGGGAATELREIPRGVGWSARMAEMSGG